VDIRRLFSREGNPLPEGTIAVGAGLMVNGLAIFAFLSISARVLGPKDFAPLSVLWALVFLAGPGLFLPLEQETSRALSNRWARNMGVGPLVRQAGTVGVALVGAVTLVALAAISFVRGDLLDNDLLLYGAFLVATAGYACVHLGRGVLAGQGRFGAYSRLFIGEGLSRVVLAGLLALLGVQTAGPYGVLVAIAPFIGLGVALWGQKDLITPGPPAPWGELTGAIGSLLAASIFTAFLLNAGTLVVERLASPSEEEAAGVFAVGLIIARVPLFLFQAVQATLLPKLSALAGAGRFDEFRQRLWRLLAVVITIGVLGVVAAAVVGPLFVHILFGQEFDLGSRDLALLAAAMGLFMIGVSIGQSLIALSGQVWVAVGWFAGAVVFAVVTWMGDDLFLRVELGLLAGTATAAALLSLFSWVRLHSHLRAMPHTLTPLDDVPTE
jgi:O-antigen/teichoic acid export membrane protein